MIFKFRIVVISENSYSLKNVEKFYEFKREGDVQKGDVSQEYYIEWLETQDQNFLDEMLGRLWSKIFFLLPNYCPGEK